ncbi:hypothetical protein [Sphingomonas sp. CFBP 8760]|uniref:hypothetical protein n=1 Tax=Sphingomonas sp. CFBP 8760 TaxID=2775282 RepID=UPI00177CE07B|nr:hypothetical protein [Sphingomonas sp. CFBP 8760]MBD8547838.1 hypothetical protein [Sphingomonas sp. CFBP 8760]
MRIFPQGAGVDMPDPDDAGVMTMETIMPDQDKDEQTPQPVKTDADDATVEESGAGYGNNAGTQGEAGKDEE